MLLVVDVGNSQTVLGIYDGDLLRATSRIETKRDESAERLWRRTRRFIGAHEVEAVAVGSVVPSAARAFASACRTRLGVRPLVVGPDTPVPIEVVPDRRRLGSDRLANAVAAYSLVRGAVIVVDLGTATKFDVVDEGGRYLGGAIAPGIATGAEALAGRAARLRRVSLETPSSAIGADTRGAMLSGIVMGAAAMVDGMIARMRDELRREPEVIMTGGLARLVLDVVKTPARFEPTLTLDGLRAIFAHATR